jgi:hypothetical protein
MSPAFVCVAFGPLYVEQQKRLKESILSIYPDAPLFFWTDELPNGSQTFQKSLYGFKPHAVNAALEKGYKQIVFFDPAVILTDRVDFYQNVIHEYGVIAVPDANKLHRFCYKKALDHFSLTKHDIMDWHLVGGSFYYFDFDLPLCHTIFNKWIDAERLGLFGSQQEQASERLHGHRSDEAIMALALYTSGSRPMSGLTRYNCEGGVTLKKHFK